MLAGGYAGKYLRVDLTHHRVNTKKLEEDIISRFWGGRGWGGYILLRELEGRIDPFSAENKVLFLTGPLQGTMTPFTPKFCVLTKSPLAGTFTRTLCGGQWGPELKFAGYDGIIVEGKSPVPVYLFVDGGRVEIRDAENLRGMTTGATEKKIRDELEDRTIRVVAIGPAGEKQVRFANVIHESRAAGRGGTGAVLGSKNLKAIAVRGRGSVEIADLGRYKELLLSAYCNIKSNPAVPNRIKYGTAETVKMAHNSGFIPIENYSRGVFAGIQGLLPETMREQIVFHDESCFACPLPCGKLSVVREGPFAGTVLQGPQYETIGLLGTNCGVSNIRAVARANFLCNEYGMDTISTGNVIGYAIEAFQKGFLSRQDVGVPKLDFGDEDLILELITKIAGREGIGDRLAEGVKRFSEELGGEAVKFAMHSKGQEYAAFDPRGAVGMGLLYATATTGANHSLGPTIREEIKNLLTGTGKAKILIENQNSYCFLDSAIFCSFSRYGLDQQSRIEFLSAVTGWDCSEAEAAELANRIYSLERIFNLREGFVMEDDTLAFRSLEEPMPDGPGKGNVVPLSEMLPEYYALRGWDRSGRPSKSSLERLGLADFIDLV